MNLPNERIDLEVRVPISPTPDFFRRVHFLGASLRALSGSVGNSLLVICVGGDTEPVNLCEAQPWSKNYPIVWHWADREMFRRDSYWETSRDIFRQPILGETVICADADVLFVADFSELLTELKRDPAIAGVIAHAPAIQNAQFATTWRELAVGYGAPDPAFAYEHTGWGFMVRAEALRYTPAYFNFGMVAMPARLMEIISREIETADEFVTAKLETFFRFQIALTLSILKHQVPVRPLPLRYNFPNDPRFDQRYSDELAEVKVLHYLRREVVDRERDFSSLNATQNLVAKNDLSGSNEVLRQKIAELLPTVAAEEKGAINEVIR